MGNAEWVVAEQKLKEWREGVETRICKPPFKTAAASLSRLSPSGTQNADQLCAVFMYESDSSPKDTVVSPECKAMLFPCRESFD